MNSYFFSHFYLGLTNILIHIYANKHKKNLKIRINSFIKFILIPIPNTYLSLVIKLHIFRNKFIFFSYFYIRPITILIHIQVSKHKGIHELELIS